GLALAASAARFPYTTLFRSAGGAVASLIALALVAWGLLRGIRVFLERSPWRIPSLARQGLANLYRQGNQAQAILVALGLGVMFTDRKSTRLNSSHQIISYAV